MLEWICPKCQRAVDPGFITCPFCGHSAAAAEKGMPATAQQAPSDSRGRARRAFAWADVDRGFRFGLGLVAALAVAYFVLFIAAYVADHPEWLDRLSRVLRFR
jgi:hypothetical protein